LSIYLFIPEGGGESAKISRPVGDHQYEKSPKGLTIPLNNTTTIPNLSTSFQFKMSEERYSVSFFLQLEPSSPLKHLVLKKTLKSFQLSFVKIESEPHSWSLLASGGAYPAFGQILRL